MVGYTPALTDFLLTKGKIIDIMRKILEIEKKSGIATEQAGWKLGAGSFLGQWKTPRDSNHSLLARGFFIKALVQFLKTVRRYLG